MVEFTNKRTRYKAHIFLTSFLNLEKCNIIIIANVLKKVNLTPNYRFNREIPVNTLCYYM